MQVGVFDEILDSRFSPTVLMRSKYVSAACAGASSFWVGDQLNSLVPRSIATPRYMGAARVVPRINAVHEPWTMLGHLAARHRFGRMRLGVGVTDPARRNPAVTAQAAASLNLLTRGRAILGIGTGERANNEPYGVNWSRPVARFEEAIATIRALWDSGGRRVSRDSAYFPLKDAVFDLPPYRGRWPELWLAAHGPRMLRITGRYADAWFPANISRPRDYAERLDAVRAAASDASRDPMAITPALMTFAVVGRDRDDVAEALDSVAVKFIALYAPAETWARHGAQHPLGSDSLGGQDILPHVLDEQTARDYAARVPPPLLDEITLNGTPDDVAGQAAELRDHGVRHLVVGNISTLQHDIRKALTSTLVFAGALRQLRKL